jgi:hypothetical protein
MYKLTEVNRKHHREYMRKYRLEHPEKINRERTNETSLEWYHKNRDGQLAKGKIYRDTHKEQTKLYREKNAMRIAACKKKLYEEKKTEILRKNRARAKLRYMTDPYFRLVSSLRTRMKNALRKNKKTDHTLMLVGCTLGELRNRIEGKFKSGMTWDNYGIHGWHLDHIIPCVAFNLFNFEEQKRCFHYTNLQPLWAEENLKKHARLM